MNDKKIKSAAGDSVCEIFRGIGILAIFGGLASIVAALIKEENIFPVQALYIVGAGMMTYAVGAIIWNLTEITVNSRMILRELEKMNNRK